MTLNTAAAVFVKYNPNDRISVMLGNPKNINLSIANAIDNINNRDQVTFGKPTYYYGSLLNNR